MLDFNINEDGELLYNSNTKDIDYVNKDNLIKQIATNRIKSIVGNWFNSTIGANLEEFLGMPNNTKTATEITDRVKSALTYDEFLRESDIYFIPKIDRNIFSLKVFIKAQHDIY